MIDYNKNNKQQEQDQENNDATSNSSSGGGGAHIFTPKTLIAALENAIKQDAKAGIFSPEVVKQLNKELTAMKKTLNQKYGKQR